MEDSKAEGEGSAMSCRDGGAHACPERKATDLPAVGFKWLCQWQGGG